MLFLLSDKEIHSRVNKVGVAWPTFPLCFIFCVKRKSSWNFQLPIMQSSDQWRDSKVGWSSSRVSKEAFNNSIKRFLFRHACSTSLRLEHYSTTWKSLLTLRWKSFCLFHSFYLQLELAMTADSVLRSPPNSKHNPVQAHFFFSEGAYKAIIAD